MYNYSMCINVLYRNVYYIERCIICMFHIYVNLYGYIMLKNIYLMLDTTASLSKKSVHAGCLLHSPGLELPVTRCSYLSGSRATHWLSSSLQCSVSCGIGVMHRSVQCLTNEDQPSHLCPADTKPEERKTCRNVYNCKSLNSSLLCRSWRTNVSVSPSFLET